jgi:hypothetical protein
MKSLKRKAAEAIGIKELRLTPAGRFDITDEQRAELTDLIGPELLCRLEESLKETEKQTKTTHKIKTMSKPEFKWKGIGSSLGVDSLEMSDEGVYLSAGQLDTIDAALTSAHAAQTKAEGDLQTAKTEKKTAEDSLTEAAEALDDLADSVKEAKDLKGKVEAVRQELAKRPAVPASGVTGGGQDGILIESPDEVNSFANEYFTK